MKKILLLLYIVLSFSNLTEIYANEIKLRIFGHVYLDNQNNPLNNFRVYVKKYDEIIGEGRSNKEGKFDFLINNRDEFINLCIQSTSFSEIENISSCVTISAFQKIGRIVDGVEIRELEYSFFTNKDGINLNQRLEDEINNIATEKAFEEYERIRFDFQQQKEEEEIQQQKEEEYQKLKAKYKMVNNTEMIAPLSSIQIIGTVKDEDSSLITNRTFVQITDHLGNSLYNEPIGQFNDYNITLTPFGGKEVFMHPLNMKIYNSQSDVIKGNRINIFTPEYRLITREKNIINIELKKHEYNDFTDKFTTVREKFPILGIFIIIFIFTSGIVILIKNKNYYIRNY